jgi:hypothetical protein
MPKIPVALTAVAALAAAAAFAPAASASPVVTGGTAAVIDCNARVDFNIHVSSARGMSCRSAAKDLRRYDGSIATRFRTPGGFACRRVTGVPQGGQWRCVSGSRAYRFEFAD